MDLDYLVWRQQELSLQVNQVNSFVSVLYVMLVNCPWAISLVLNKKLQVSIKRKLSGSTFAMMLYASWLIFTNWCLFCLTIVGGFPTKYS